MERGTELADHLEGASSLAIVCHDSPDPDCLASALALEAIARDCGVETVDIVYGGDISHQQNRAFVNLLAIDAEDVPAVDLSSVDRIAFVDHSREGTSSVVPAGTTPDVVVDHHPGETIDAPFVDVRTEYGATATIFVEYLEELAVDVTDRLGSALLFAIHRERLDFVRDPTDREYEAALEVYPDAQLDLLEELYGSAFSPATIDAIGRAINTRERRGSALVANVGHTVETDALPQAADYLLNVEGVDTALVYGVVDGTIRISARSIDPRVHTGETLEEAFGSVGAVGGHHDMAGGRIDLGLFADDDDDREEVLSLVGARVEQRFFEAMHLDGDTDDGPE